MAYAGGNFKYDVFISYALADNEPQDDSWVTHFKERLQIALRQRTGVTDQFKFFFSPERPPDGNYTLEEFAKDASAAAVMVSVTSPAYVTPRNADREPITIQELKGFLQVDPEGRRLFVAQILPYVDGDARHAVLRKKMPIKFWYEKGGRAYRIDPTDEAMKRAFNESVQDLADSIGKVLREMRDAPPPSEPPIGTVLLAQGTDDIERELGQVRRHLKQYNIRVLPEASYPPTALEFEAAFKADLAKADLVVQLLGKAPGRHPQGYVGMQADLAVGAGKPPMQWRQPGAVSEAEVEDETLRKRLENPAVSLEGLEAFKAAVVDRIQRPPQPEIPPQPGLVFINADKKDMALAASLHDTVKQHGFGASIPIEEGEPDEVLEDLINNIVSCDALVLIYGNSKPVWLRKQQLLYNKLRRRREEPARVITILTAPPPDKPEPDRLLPEVGPPIGPTELLNALSPLRH